MAASLSHRVLGLLACALILILLGSTGPGAAFSGGAPSGTAQSGCTCHASQASSGVTVAVAGFPAAYEANVTYDLTLTINGGPPALPGGANQGGFAIQASFGTFAPKNDRAKTMDDGAGLTHTGAGATARTWAFQWTAPAAAATFVEFHWAGNAVNGNVLPDPADEWALGNATIPPMVRAADAGGNETPDAEGDGEDETPPAGVILGIAAIAGVALGLARIRRA